MDDEDQIRELIASRLRALGMSERHLSVALGRDGSYINTYMNKKSPRRLSHEDKVNVARLLKMSRKELGISEPDPAQSSSVTGFSEDAAPYVPPSNSWMAKIDHSYTYEV